MALKAVHMSDVSNYLDQVPENNPSLTTSICSPRFSQGSGGITLKEAVPSSPSKFVVIGHRGNGMNMMQNSTTPTTDHRRSSSSSCRIKENTITSFNAAGKYPIQYIEFDVQVTKDDCPIIFHDNFIFSEDSEGRIYEKRVTDLSLSEFLTYGPQKEQGKIEKPLFRKTKEGKIVNWNTETDDISCTLQQAFENVTPHLGFNIELKFDDHLVYSQDNLIHTLKSILQVVFTHAKERPIIFSTFQPDAALLVKKLQNTYPVYFLTTAGGNEIHYDTRRNTLEEAIEVCLEGGLEGIVSEVRGIFRNPGAVQKIKEAKLSVLTYGKLNNVAEAVYMQHLMGIEGVIVDFVQEISETVSNNMLSRSDREEEQSLVQVEAKAPQFSQTELSFLLKLIPELIQQ